MLQSRKVSGWSCAYVVATMILVPATMAADYSTIEIDETAGLDRENWPVQVGVPVDEGVSADSLQLVKTTGEDAWRKVEFQVLDEIAPVYFDDAELDDGIKTVEIAFLIDLPADGSQKLRLYGGEPDVEFASSEGDSDAPILNIDEDEGLARTIDTGSARFKLHADSGQLLDYELVGTDFNPTMGRDGNLPAHGGADVWSPPHGWGNVRSWDLDNEDHNIEYEEASGPIAWRLVRTGYVPNSNGVEVSLSYTAFAGTPFVLESTRMQFRHDTAVNAVRNNQLVFSRGLHTHGVYMDHDGQINAARAFNPDDHDENFHLLGIDLLAPDIPFIGMFSEDHGAGVGMVTLDRTNQSTSRIAGTQDTGSSYYFFDASIHGNHDRNFFYFVRAEIFPAVYLERESYPYWSWHGTVVPDGAVFAANSAILPFSIGEEDDADRFQDIEHWTKLLQYPPRIVTRRP